MHKKDYIIVKDRYPRVSEVLWDCKAQLCIPASKDEPLSSILTKLCSKINNNFTQLSQQIREFSVYSLEDGNNTTVSGSGTEADPWKVNVTGTLNGWSLTGNAGTNPATNFLGTMVHWLIKQPI